jgi:hypothetical protein
MIINLAACSQKTEVSSLADKIINYSKAKDFKSIYPLLSDEDRQSISADSFYVACYTAYVTLDSSGSLSFLGSYVEKISSDTFIVHEIVRLADYELLAKIRKGDKELTKSDVQKMADAGTLPLKVDTLRLKFVKENDSYKFAAGYSENARYSFLVDSLREESCKSAVATSVNNLEIKSYEFTPDIFVSVHAILENLTNYKVGMITYDLSIDSVSYGQISFTFGDDPLKPNQTVTTWAYMSDDFAKKVVEKYPKTRSIESKRLILRINNIYYPDDFKKIYNGIDSLASQKSNSKAASSPYIISLMAALAK